MVIVLVRVLVQSLNGGVEDLEAVGLGDRGRDFDDLGIALEDLVLEGRPGVWSLKTTDFWCRFPDARPRLPANRARPRLTRRGRCPRS